MSGKTIQLNPAFLSFKKNGSKKNGTLKKEKPQLTIHNNTNNIKKKLIEKVKNFQKKHNDQIDKTNTDTDNNNNDTINNFNTEFNKSLNFLEDLSNKRKEKQQQQQQQRKENLHKTTLKNGKIEREIHTQTQHEIATELPTDLFAMPAIYKNNKASVMPLAPAVSVHPPAVSMHTPQPPSLYMPTPLVSPPLIKVNLDENYPPPQHVNAVHFSPAPPYSNLKNSSLPTFKQWKNQTQKKHTSNSMNTPMNTSFNTPPLIQIENYEKNEVPTERSIELEKFKNDYKDKNAQTPIVDQLSPNPIVVPPPIVEQPNKIKKRITRTKKYTLGRKNNKIGVLIKNAKTRKLVQHDLALLKNTTILDVKNYLREKNLIKVSTDAPNDVLRELYEQSILAGDVENKAGDVLIHNYMNKK